jgi:plastocyanin
MKKFISALVIIGLSTASFAGDLTGTVTYDGKAPKKKTLRMDSDPVCGAAHKDAVYTESFIVDENGNFANVFVYLKNAKSDSAPSGAAVIDQNGCMYSPHVLGVQAGQELKILNSDPTMHNIHGLPKVNKEFNFGMPKTVKEKKVTFKKPEDVFVVKCDVHPWMKSYVQVFDHPYFAVTGLDGKFTISGIPDGEYEVVAWQEKFGSKRIMTQSVSIEKETQTLNFTFSRPKKK